MTEEPLIKGQIRAFIATNLIHDPDYPLGDDESLISGGLIDLASLEELARYLEEAFGVLVDDAELTTDHVDTLNEIILLVQSRLE